jgi:hypothetical protein
MYMCTTVNIFFISELLFYKVSYTEKMFHYNISKVILSLLLNMPGFMFTKVHKVRRQQKNIILLNNLQPKWEC